MSVRTGRPVWSYLIPSRPPPLEPKHWNVLGLVLVAEMAAQYCSALLVLTLPQVQTGLAMSEDQIGTIGGVVRIGMVATVFITVFADRIGRRRMLLGSTALLCALAGASGLATTFEQFLVLQTLMRVFIGAEFMLAMACRVNKAWTSSSLSGAFRCSGSDLSRTPDEIRAAIAGPINSIPTPFRLSLRS